MRIGAIIGTRGTVDDVVAEARQAVDLGLSTVWMAQVSQWEALTVLAVVGREVPGIEVGTAVIPTYPRHPSVLAVQALTTQSITGGRLALGIGLSHPMVIEGSYGLSYEKPARHMREYLSVLVPLLKEGRVDFTGETLTGRAQVGVPGASTPQVLLAALAPRMLEMAGAVADGTITWMTGPKTIETHIVPSINAAADKAGREAPRVVCGLPVCVTDDPGPARERMVRGFMGYGALPSYRAMLDKEGVENAPDVAIVGDEAHVGETLERIAAGGATDFEAAVVGSSEERARTFALLSELSAA